MEQIKEVYELSFAKIIRLQDDIAEVIINQGVEMDERLVNQYHDFLRSHFSAPFSLLINKLNAYTYDFMAQKKIATLPEINAMAVVSYNRVTQIATESLASFPREVKWNLQIFGEREQALSWLVSQQSKMKSSCAELL